MNYQLVFGYVDSVPSVRRAVTRCEGLTGNFDQLDGLLLSIHFDLGICVCVLR